MASFRTVVREPAPAEAEMSEPNPLDDPEKRGRVVRTLLGATVFLFAFCYVLAWAQGAPPRHALLIAVVGAAMCLAAAGVIHLMGSKSVWALAVVKIALVLAKRR